MRSSVKRCSPSSCKELRTDSNPNQKEEKLRPGREERCFPCVCLMVSFCCFLLRMHFLPLFLDSNSSSFAPEWVSPQTTVSMRFFLLQQEPSTGWSPLRGTSAFQSPSPATSPKSIFRESRFPILLTSPHLSSPAWPLCATYCCHSL